MAATSRMDTLLDNIEARIATITPSFAADITFRLCSDSAKLEHQTFGDRIDGCRRFDVIPGVLAGYRGAIIGNGRGGDWNGDLAYLTDSIEIAIRYEWAAGDGGVRFLRRMIATDQQLIIRAIHPLAGDYPDPNILHDIYPTGTVQVDEIETKNSEVLAQIVRIQFDLVTSLGDP